LALAGFRFSSQKGTTMENNEFFDAITAAIGAAQSYLDTDAAYGPDDPRTLGSKERLAQAMQVLTPTSVDVPELHVIRGGALEIRNGAPEVVELTTGFWPPEPGPRAVDEQLVRDEVRRWAPAPSRDGWDRER
jgi:hypothetical protein